MQEKRFKISQNVSKPTKVNVFLQELQEGNGRWRDLNCIACDATEEKVQEAMDNLAIWWRQREEVRALEGTRPFHG